MMFGMGVFGIFFWVVVIGLVVWGVGQLAQNRKTGRHEVRNTPTAILEGRYARGEIDKEQFQQMRKELEA